MHEMPGDRSERGPSSTIFGRFAPFWGIWEADLEGQFLREDFLNCQGWFCSIDNWSFQLLGAFLMFSKQKLWVPWTKFSFFRRISFRGFGPGFSGLQGARLWAQSFR